MSGGLCANRKHPSPNGEVEGPRRSDRLEPRVHTLFQHPRRHYRLSRTPPTIVRHPRLPRSYSPYRSFGTSSSGVEVRARGRTDRDLRRERGHPGVSG
jgi:hypothetical protein